MKIPTLFLRKESLICKVFFWLIVTAIYFFSAQKLAKMTTPFYETTGPRNIKEGQSSELAAEAVKRAYTNSGIRQLLEGSLQMINLHFNYSKLDDIENSKDTYRGARATFCSFNFSAQKLDPASGAYYNWFECSGVDEP